MTSYREKVAEPVREGFSFKAKRQLVSVGLFAASAGLIVLGFAVDGASEIGHHAGFILGGVALGYGFGRH